MRERSVSIERHEAQYCMNIVQTVLQRHARPKARPLVAWSRCGGGGGMFKLSVPTDTLLTGLPVLSPSLGLKSARSTVSALRSHYVVTLHRNVDLRPAVLCNHDAPDLTVPTGSRSSLPDLEGFSGLAKDSYCIRLHMFAWYPGLNGYNSCSQKRGYCRTCTILPEEDAAPEKHRDKALTDFACHAVLCLCRASLRFPRHLSRLPHSLGSEPSPCIANSFRNPTRMAVRRSRPNSCHRARFL